MLFNRVKIFKYILAANFALLALTSTEAQIRVDLNTYKNIFKFDVASAAVMNEYVFAYERTVGENFSLVLSGGVIANNYELSETFTDGSTRNQFSRTSGWLVQPEARFYLSEFTGGRQPGAYLGVYPFVRRELQRYQGDAERYQYLPEVSGGTENLEWATYESQYDQFGVGFNIGLQVFAEHQLGFELQYFIHLLYGNFDLKGTEFYTLGANSIDRRQFNRDFTSGLRLNIIFGTRPKS